MTVNNEKLIKWGELKSFEAKIKAKNDISLSDKVDKVNGKQLSTNDFTNEYKTKVDGALQSSKVGVANGVASLDATSKIPSSQLPSYVDDVLEYDAKAGFPPIGETGKIYVDKMTNLTYRWGGTAYIEISPSLALGETASTAYAGDKGKSTTDKVNAIIAGTTKVPKATNADTVNGHSVEADVPANAKFTDTIYTHPTSDGNKHIPATGTINNGKFLKAGATAGSANWGDITKNDVVNALGYTPPQTIPTFEYVTESDIDEAITELFG